jgi:hypothetical protein
MRILLWILGAPNVANGIWMLVWPEAWYTDIPAAVPDTGPLNLHFVRDIGAAFITGGLGLCLAAEAPRYRQPAIWGAATFFGLHAAIHVADLIAGRLPADHWWVDAPTVFFPALLLIALSMRRFSRDVSS